MSKYVRPVEDMRAKWTDRSTGPLQPVDTRSQDRMSFSLSPSSCVWPVKESDRPVDWRSIIGRGTDRVHFRHSLSPSGWLLPVVNRSIPGRIPVGSIFFILSLPVAVCDRLRMVASRSCVHHWPVVTRSNTCRGFSNRSTGFVSPVVNPVDTRPRQLLSSFFSKCFVWNFSCWRSTPHTVCPPNASYQSENTYVR